MLMCMYTRTDILKIMHENMFVVMLIMVFTATFCAHIIPFDGNLACFCPVYTLLLQESWPDLATGPPV